jgi:hypothetical protein
MAGVTFLRLKFHLVSHVSIARQPRVYKDEGIGERAWAGRHRRAGGRVVVAMVVDSIGASG